MESCLFCKIIKGEIPGIKLYEDGDVVALLDINPVNPGHMLVVPKVHYSALYDMPDDLLAKIAPTIKFLATHVKLVLVSDGVNIIQNNEPAAGQVIFHYHVHIIPRFKDDGFRHWHGKPYAIGEAEEIAQKIKEGL